MGCPVLQNVAGGNGERGCQDVAEQRIYYMMVAHDDIMSGLTDNMGGLCPPDGENFVARAVYMEEGLGDDGILPVEHCFDGPDDKTVISGPDHFAHRDPVFV